MHETPKPPLGHAARAPRVTLRAAMAIATALLLLSGCRMVEEEARRAAGGLLSSAQSALALPDLGVDSTRVLLVGAGAVLLLAGWKLHRFIVAVPGFALAGSIGALVTSRITDNALTIVVAVVIAGALGAWIALSLFRLGIFVSGALGGIVLADRAWAAVYHEGPPIYVVLGGAILGGLLLLGLMGVWMPVVSAAIGAGLIGTGLELGIEVTVALAVVGVLVQMGIARSIGENAFARPPARERGQ